LFNKTPFYATQVEVALANRNILVLEDEPLVAMMLQDELEALGIHVIGPANNLKSALQLAEFPKLDGALLDLNINGKYATKVADKLHIRGVPFTFVTGHERPPGLRYREASILRKPFTQIDLRLALISLLEKSPPGSQSKI
jgi:DNA-binding response OmpR family regulator